MVLVNAARGRYSDKTIKPRRAIEFRRDVESCRGKLSSRGRNEEGSTGYRVSVHRAPALTADGAETVTARPPAFVNRRGAYRFYLPRRVQRDRVGILQGWPDIAPAECGTRDLSSRGYIIPRAAGESGRNNGRDNGFEQFSWE